MNPATALATVLVDELARCGVREAVLSPGSWSTPIAMAVADHPDIRLHVRIDERSAGFLAVGLAKASQTPALVLCTSGTAAANLHPAVLEADLARVPLVVITADRPPEQQGTGSSQTVDQLKLYGPAVRLFVHLGQPERRPGSVNYWRSVAARAVGTATEPTAIGPVHLNVAFRKPLLGGPDAAAEWPESLTGRPGRAPWVHIAPRATPSVAVPAPRRGLLVLGDGAIAPERAIAAAEAAGWPVLAEPSSGGRHGPHALVAGSLLLSVPEFISAYRPEMLVTLGRPTLAPELAELGAAVATHVVVDPAVAWTDPGRSASQVVPDIELIPSGTPDPVWLSAWQRADAAACAALAAEVDGASGERLTEPALARELAEAAPDGSLLFVGSSMPIRDLDATMRPRRGLRVLTNRGVSGIDGVVSTAIGAALAHQRAGGGPAFALLGDLTMLHDQNGLILGPEEPRPQLTIFVVNNDGGAIFSMLAQAGVPKFERIFGTPHRVNFAAVAAANGIEYRAVTTNAELDKLVAVPADGLVLAEVRTERSANAALHARMQAAARRAVAATV